MGFLDTLNDLLAPQRATDPEVISATQTSRKGLSSFDPASLDPSQLRTAYRSLVQMLINYRARNFAPHMGDVTIQSRAGEDYEEVESDHPWAMILRRPSPNIPRGMLWQWAFQNIDAFGHADFLVEHEGILGRRVPSILHPVFPEYGDLTPSYDRKGEIEHWTYRMTGGKWAKLEPEDVLRLKAVHPSAPWMTAGKIEAAAYEVDQLSAQNVYSRDMARDQGKPKVALESEQEVSRQKAIRMGRQFAQMYRAGGPDMVPVSGGGMKVNPLVLNPKDMEFLEQQKFTWEKLFTIFEVPPGIMTGEAYATGKKAARIGFHQETVQPTVDDAVEQLEFHMERLFSVEEPGQFRLVSPNTVPMDREQQAKIDKMRIGAGATINEIKENRGEEPVGPEGDKVLVPGNLMPLEQVAQGLM